MKVALIFVLTIFFAHSVVAQVNAAFSMPSQACIDQNIILDNQSTGAIRYEWDLCQGDLTLATTAEMAKTLGGSVTTGTDMVFDGTNWFAFVTSQGTNSIKRLDFGNSIYSVPTVQDLGNISGKTNSPTDIKIVNDNGQWYGFVYNLSDPMITRIDFGTSLTNTTSSPSPVTATAIVSGSGTVNGGFDIMFSTNWNLVVTRNSDVTMIRLPSITATPAVSDIIAAVPDPLASALGDVVLKKQGNNYYGFVVAWGNKSLQKLSFGTDLFSTPTITDLSVTGLSGITPYGIDIGVDNGNNYLFISSLEGKIMRVDLGANLASPVITPTLLSLSGVENTLKIRLIKHQSNWIALAPSWSSTNLYRLIFTASSCSDFPNVLTTNEPFISFNAAGTRAITLRAFASSGWYSDISNTVNITSNVAPAVDFTIDGICENFSSVFNTSNAGIQTYDWDFGDASSAAVQSPTHAYSAAGSYDVSLEVSASNGCTNFISKTIAIYKKPTPSFTLPSGLVCTNNELTFVNTTTDNFDGNLSYDWAVNSTPVSNTRDLNYVLTQTGDNTIKLTTSIPGCSASVSQVLADMQEGPTAAFTFEGQCQSDDVIFHNASTGSITGTSWTFENGATSGATNPTYAFATAGIHTVQLSTTAANGCVSSTTNDVTVYTKPVVSFTLDLPPFSCSGTPSQFHDLTGSLPDSNIQSWTWTFGDSGTGTGKNPTHTYINAGPYNVNLSITTDKGCSGNATQPITITQSPTASFSLDPACVNQATKLKDTSTGNIAGWQWKIGSVIYTTPGPTHTFTLPGNYAVQLSVTSQNSCVNTVTKQVIVPVIAVPDFDITNACADQPAKFTDITSSPADPVAESNWTFNNNSNGSGTQVEFTFAAPGSFSILLQVKTQSGCVYSSSKNVLIHPSPVASFNVSDDSGPAPLAVLFTNTTSGASSYQWNFNDGSAATNETSPSHIFSALGDYSVDLVATNTEGCSKTATKIISVVDPKNDLTLEEFTLVRPSGSNSYRGYVRVRNNGNYSIDGFYVTYGVGGGLLLKEAVVAPLGKGAEGTFQLNNEFLSPGPSAYICAELDNDGNNADNKACETFEDVAVILGSYPNPADVYLNIESILPQAGPVRVRLYTASGGLAYDRLFEAGTGLSRLSLDIQNLSPGIYIAVVTAGATTSSHRILIAR